MGPRHRGMPSAHASPISQPGERRSFLFAAANDRGSSEQPLLTLRSSLQRGEINCFHRRWVGKERAKRHWPMSRCFVTLAGGSYPIILFVNLPVSGKGINTRVYGFCRDAFKSRLPYPYLGRRTDDKCTQCVCLSRDMCPASP